MEKKTEQDNNQTVLPVDSTSEKISRKDLNKIVNTINFINFQDKQLNIIFRHNTSGRLVSVKANPEPCVKDRLECSWAVDTPPSQSYEFDCISISDGLKLTTISPELKFIDNNIAVFDLSKAAVRVTGDRKSKRHAIEGVEVEIYQNGLMYDASLLDFSGDSLKVEYSLNQKYPVSYINKEDTIFVALRDQNKEVIYFGECRVTHYRDNVLNHTYVLELTKKGIQRFRKRNSGVKDTSLYRYLTRYLLILSRGKYKR